MNYNSVKKSDLPIYYINYISDRYRKIRSKNSNKNRVIIYEKAPPWYHQEIVEIENKECTF
jgi:hypothetical protein